MERYLALEVKINSERCFVLNIYASNKDSVSVKSVLGHLINVFKKDDRTFADKIIAGGVFN